MNTTLSFRGARAEPSPATLDVGEFRMLFDVESKDEFRFRDVRDASVVDIELDDDDIVEVALDGGVQLWLAGGTVRQLYESTGEHESRDGVLRISPVLPIGTPTRGFGRWAINTLRRLVLREAESGIARLGALALAERLENGLMKTTGGEAGEGLFACNAADVLGDRVSGTIDGGDAPTLLFLHGTASRYDGSFGKLPENVWDRLRKRYGSRIFALQHRTLTESPIRNAIALLERLPARAKLHIVSHSRGGLIGELLCRSMRTDNVPFDDFEIRRFVAAADRASGSPERAYRQQANELLHLSELLREKQPQIERFVRVACPANGTTLASGRLDLYFSILLNGIRLLLPAHPVTSFVSATLAALIKTRANPAVLPGLEAMMPESPLIAVLNRRDIEVTADLTVIAGDMEGRGALGTLQALVTDLFYRENHDLVVHTRAMVGGAPRSGNKARFGFKKGDGIDHFHYFAKADTAERVFLGLSRADESNAGFEVIEKDTAESLKSRDAALREARIERATRAARDVQKNRPVVFVLPGIMGTQLRSGDDQVWVNLFHLARGRFEGLAINAKDVVTDGLMEGSYRRLVRHLSVSYRVIEFPYDWRRTVPETAELLAAEVARVLDETNQPIRFLAHSMGGLVTRAMIGRHRELWDRVTARKGSRLVMLGTPNRGSWTVPRVLLGHDRLVKILSIVDLRQNEQKLLSTIAQFSGLVEMLPDDARFDFFSPAGWTDIDIDQKRPRAIPEQELLLKGREVRTLLGRAESVDPANMVYVAGVAPATPIGFRVRGDRVEFMATSQGDGTVPWSLGLLDRVPTYYMEAKHGDMANVPRHFPAIVDLLEGGTTAALPQEPKAALRAAVQLFPMPEDEVIAFPEQDDIESIILQADPRSKSETQEAEPLRVSIAHGNLAFARWPVMVGHYEGDTIAGAEAALDRHFGGWLSEHRQLDLYPGELDTAAVFLRKEEDRPSGAIVIGLGDVGSLTPLRLERTVTHAVLTCVAKLVERADDQMAAGPIETGLTSLFIGSGRGGMPLEDSVRAIVGGVVAARARLRDVERHSRVRISELMFVELFEDIALQAAAELRQMSSETRFQALIDPSDEVRSLPGRQRRTRFIEEGRWWNRLEICEDEKTGSLKFQNLTLRRARSESYMQPTQRQLIDGFVRDAIATAEPDPGTASTLFELLVPNTLKEYAPDQNDLVLIVDEASARYPWELMADRRTASAEPIAVRAGLVRSLSVETFRERPQAVIGNHALVVGDPPSELTELPGAQEEAQAVADMLGREGFSVTPLIRPAPRTVVTQLFARDYKILHFAAHGVHDWEATIREARPGETKPLKQRLSGMVIGPGFTVLTPAEVQQMRAVPELVFINCCHLGRTDVDVEDGDQSPLRIEAEQRRLRHRLAANLAAEFIRMGVRAVIAAGWAVDDSAAITFATTFYRGMLAGRPFGEAVKQARSTTYREHPAVNTWGAYQCYGDPGYILQQPKDGWGGDGEAETFASAAELIVRLENMAQYAETIVQRDLKAEQKHALGLFVNVKQRRPDWLKKAAVQVAFARAFAELDLFAEAIDCYEHARANDGTNIAIRDIEQLANLLVRDAIAQYLESERDDAAGETARRKIQSGIAHLDALPPGSPLMTVRSSWTFTPERLSLHGSAHKRLSMVLRGQEMIDSLLQMEQLYARAEQAIATEPYPALNRLAARVLLDQHGALPETPDWYAELDRVRSLAAAADQTSPDFWQMVTRSELLVLQLLIEAKPESFANVLAGYRAAWLRGGTPRKLRSAIEQLRWIEAVLSDAGPPPRSTGRPSKRREADARRRSETRHTLAAAVARIRSELTTWTT
jgi:CHAT domain-containing protein/pimeloyl-ACP methyl ester carboxylesterase